MGQLTGHLTGQFMGQVTGLFTVSLAREWCGVAVGRWCYSCGGCSAWTRTLCAIQARPVFAANLRSCLVVRSL